MKKKIRLAILGLGNVPLAVLRYMEQPGPKKALADTGIEVVVTGVTTGSRGNAISETGLSLADLEAVGKSGDVGALNKGTKTSNNKEFIENVPADILFVATPAKLPSVDEIKQAFARGLHVITSNKTPVAGFYPELAASAKQHGVQFRYKATVLAGDPAWDELLERMDKDSINEVQIVVNATSNNILTLMLEKGMSFEQGISAAQSLGIAERDPADDIDGHDTQKKLVILANFLWNAGLTPEKVPTQGIRNVSLDDLRKADKSGGWIQLLGTAKKQGGKITAEVKPVATTEPFFAQMRGTSMGLLFKQGFAQFGIRLDLGSGSDAILATASGVFGDLLAIAKTL